MDAESVAFCSIERLPYGVYKKGHCGVALLVFAPIGYALVVLGAPMLAFLTGASMLWLAMLPDVDHRLPLIEHRGPTHSLLFAALVGAVFAGAGFLLGDVALLAELLNGDALVGSAGVTARLRLAAFGFFVGFVTVFTHLLADVLTPMGVNFLWPISSTRYSLRLTRADSALWNNGLLAAGVFVSGATLYLMVRSAAI